MKVCRAFFVFCACLPVGTVIGASSHAKTPPDIFLITIDTLRADHVHCYGYDRVQTPALDALARDGVRFAQAFTPSPITNTAHASILTGLLPGSHGVTDFAVPLSPAHPTVAESLKKQAYHTAAFIGAIILDSKTLAPGFDRGFNYYDNFPEHSQTKARWGRVERRGMDVVQHAEAWLTKHPAGPHFMWVHLYDPHDPYEPPAPFAETYKDHLYDGEIAYADSALANFVAYLKQSGRYRNSVIVVVGDHGEGLGEHNEDTHGIFLYDSTTHVPLIVKLPGALHAGALVQAQVRSVDIAPTVLELAGAPGLEKHDGESLTPYFSGADETSRPAFGETDYPLRFGWAPLRSLRSEGFKFIEAPRPELYNLQLDSAELHNGYDAQDARVKKARVMLADLRRRENSQEPSKSAAPQGASGDLKALGYPVPAGTASANAAAASSLSSLPDPKDKIEEQNLLHAAMIASDDNRATDARQSLEKVLKLDPKSPTALLQLGELELTAGDYAKAAEHLKGALEVRPDDATAAFYAGQALQKSNDLQGARDALETSLKLMPGQFPARLLLGQVYLGLKDPKAAEDQLEAALLLQPASVEAQLALATAQITEGNFADAAQQLEALSHDQPKSAEVFDLLAKAYSGLGKSAEAERAQAHAKLLRGTH
ncbi:MAG TPA: sulfatase-like hydrolase/transferase [Candidatus Sulfotelmatobacter sp.]|nr:sulfatase-like hydrolase/transferase [Candidatus Sulfotelmatobacter sp.]